MSKDWGRSKLFNTTLSQCADKSEPANNVTVTRYAEPGAVAQFTVTASAPKDTNAAFAITVPSPSTSLIHFVLSCQPESSESA